MRILSQRQARAAIAPVVLLVGSALGFLGLQMMFMYRDDKKGLLRHANENAVRALSSPMMVRGAAAVFIGLAMLYVGVRNVANSRRPASDDWGLMACGATVTWLGTLSAVHLGQEGAAVPLVVITLASAAMMLAAIRAAWQDARAELRRSETPAPTLHMNAMLAAPSTAENGGTAAATYPQHVVLDLISEEPGSGDEEARAPEGFTN